MATRRKKKRNKAFWNNIKFKYKLTITNENTLEEVAGLHVSKLNGLSVLLSVLLVLFTASSLIVAFTPLRNYLPGYMNSEVRAQIVANALRVDSLQQLLERQNLYIMNIQDIFLGKVKADTVRSIDSLTVIREDSLMERTQREMEFRKQYEENEKYNLTGLTARAESGGVIFYRPTRGMVIAPFDADRRHYGTDLAATPGEAILSTLDGTVILSTYTASDGYVVQIQHGQDFVSVYKHCAAPLKREGDTVEGGEPVAIARSPRDGQDETPRVHFELWHKGKAVNPELYVVY